MTISPDTLTSPWAWIVLGPVIALSLFVPGHLVFGRLHSPLPWVTAFIGSALLLFAGVLLLDLSPLRINLFTLGGLLALASLLGWRMRDHGRPFAELFPSAAFNKTWRQIAGEWWWAVPALFACASVLVHAAVEPLSGFDNIFRWNHLALLMEAQGSLDHYPAVTALDFRFYPWCDGIPPMIPVFNL